MAVSAALTLRLVTRARMEARVINHALHLSPPVFSPVAGGGPRRRVYTNALPISEVRVCTPAFSASHTLYAPYATSKPSGVGPGGVRGEVFASSRSGLLRFLQRPLPSVSGADLAGLGIKANPTAATAAVPRKLRLSIAVIRSRSRQKHLNAGGALAKSSPFAQASYIKGSYITRPETPL